MLTPKEERKLDGRLKEISELRNLDAQLYYWMTAKEFKWFAEKLKEVNEELKQLVEKHKELDSTLSDALQVLQDAGVLNEYLKFRNQ